MRTTKIYVLCDPRTNEIRYVGKTVKSLSARLHGHLTQSRSDKFDTYRDRWIRTLTSLGLMPDIREVETCGADWAQRERFWIAHFKAIGSRLTNHTDGGEGALGITFSEERRKKCSKRVLKELADPQVRAKRVKRLIEKATSPEFRKMRSDQHSEWMMHPDRRAKYSECMSKQMSDPDRRAKSSAHMTAVMTDPKRRAARDAKVALYWTPERRAEQAARAQAQAERRRAEQLSKAINCD